jgi:organic radical activating enzyme
MPELTDNIYNKSATKAGAKLKLWRSAGLMLTYKCSAACEFCYYRCSPSQEGVMTLDTAMSAWEGLRELAGESASIHITGGEPFLYLDQMVAILGEAKRRGLGTVDQIETNAFWADSRQGMVDTLRLLDSLGMRILKISCDPFHQEYVGIDKVRSLAAVATEVLGKDRVLVRWEKYAQDPVDTGGMAWEEKAAHYMASLHEFPCRFTGRAADRLAGIAPIKTPDELAALSCSGSFLGAKGIHVDPFGNVFSGTCSGIIIGNVNETTLAEMWRRFDPPNVEVIGRLFEGGPAALAKEAQEAGFRLAPHYAGKCHLCSDIRKFFFDNTLFAAIIGPVQCYSEGKDASPQTSEFGIEH